MSVKAFSVGLAVEYAHGPSLTKGFMMRRRLSMLLTEFVAQNTPPNFTYTTVQLNLDYSPRLHIDVNNEGPSYTIGLGAA